MDDFEDFAIVLDDAGKTGASGHEAKRLLEIAVEDGIDSHKIAVELALDAAAHSTGTPTDLQYFAVVKRYFVLDQEFAAYRVDWHSDLTFATIELDEQDPPKVYSN